ncbi:transcriptional regulator, DeoR family [Pilibacter termitis]|uniref:Lactose phosphotransferase system repressor n=1 Tax=Pilibacter termitis TaxID=263852 RepID=A0A1T4LQA8_9ENTE|nr:DeoR/GlpR family DNA-binding transcription regulator [Pilibacter termitis]SJZ56912.1 transcriptional regulator, DeoR family [Pilibacter termitis]
MDIEQTKKLLEILQRKKVMKTSELHKELYCSISTLRRALIRLEQVGIVAREHGVVKLIKEQNVEFSSNYRSGEHLEEKKYICELASFFLTDNLAIFLDSSTTVSHLIPHLRKYQGLIVITNGLNIASLLADEENMTVYVIGGELKKHSSSLFGELSDQFVANFHTDLAFFSCRGINENGLYEADSRQAMMKRKMIENSKKAICLCDSSKINTSHFFKLADFKQLEALITNEALSEELEEILEAVGCELSY